MNINNVSYQTLLVFSSLWCTLPFPLKTMSGSPLLPFVLSGVNVNIDICIYYECWLSTRFTCQMIFLSLISCTTGATSEAGTAYPSGAPEFIPVFSDARVARSLVFCVVFCR